MSDDPIRNALGELFRAAMKAAEPDADGKDPAARVAKLFGTEADTLREDPDAAKDAVGALLDGARELFTDVVSTDEARRQAAADRLDDLDARLVDAGFGGAGTLPRVPEMIAKLREITPNAEAVRDAVDDLANDPRVVDLRERFREAARGDEFDA
jgi:hypothetical protein